MGNGYPTLPCAKPARGAGPGCHFGNPTQPVGGFLFCDRKKLPKMAVSTHFRPFCYRVLLGKILGWKVYDTEDSHVGVMSLHGSGAQARVSHVHTRVYSLAQATVR